MTFFDGAIRHRTGHRDTMLKARPLTLILMGFTLLALVGGSLAMVPSCIFQQDGAGEACGLDVLLWWPLVMLVVGVLGASALGSAKRRHRIATWLGVCCVSAASLVLLVFGFGPAVESLVGPSATDPLFIGGLLVILAVGIIYAGWRLILR